jgi:DNA (cytosine-5)-methyltransferase 1
VVGGFPCQDISQAGRQAGIKVGTRSGLFYELMRVIRMVGPLTHCTSATAARSCRRCPNSRCIAALRRRRTLGSGITA